MQGEIDSLVPGGLGFGICFGPRVHATDSICRVRARDHTREIRLPVRVAKVQGTIRALQRRPGAYVPARPVARHGIHLAARDRPPAGAPGPLRVASGWHRSFSGSDDCLDDTRLTCPARYVREGTLGPSRFGSWGEFGSPLPLRRPRKWEVGSFWIFGFWSSHYPASLDEDTSPDTRLNARQVDGL